ncbi:MAG: DeoR/GlpR family DNA-binding transcription regulator [Chitinophagaceae bacterium]|jgi:DeoR/GlpR family transcriptional regulator of sugar metabolism|nr:DeoR/GlpR family DNA-binding transcription regulator [Chitinophagaceae bacterium]MCF8288871.1 DeoR/GlpR family DNA-binding transcription regulator [Chitinophagaceae bacterium]MCF8422103.1 DeoR/GlpR family DNA-binding transcription regulator [Chitinophagaceae bacterium]
MLKKERQEFILHQLNLHNKILCADLSNKMGVSDDTIRRDLQELAQEDKLIKVHGGALSKSFHTAFDRKMVYNLEDKNIIAQKTAALVQSGMYILTSGGTSILEFAKSLDTNLNATFFTCSLNAAIEFAHHPSIEVVMIGDKVSKDSMLTTGASAVQTIESIQADLCILGINSLDTQFGLSENDWEVVQIKKAMIKASKKTICIGISEKLNSQQKIKVANLDEIDILITELDPNDPTLLPFKHKGLTIY